MDTRYRVDPDRGFAWVVLVSSFLNYMISAGVAINGCSVYLAAMIRGYGCSRAEAYVAGALSSGFFFCSAPAASVLIDKVSLRAAAVVGAIVASTGLVLSANVPTLVYHYITLSITAIGCGFMYQSSIVVPVHYFVKRRALASAVVFTAGGLNMMVFPNIVRLVIDAYTWRPSFYIMAAIVLNTCVLSMLMRLTSLIKNTEQKELRGESVIDAAERRESDVTQPVLNCDEKDATTSAEGRGPTEDNAKITNILNESGGTIQKFPGLLFWLLLTDCFLFQFTLISPSIIMPDMYAVGGMNDWQTSVLFVFWGCANTLGRASGVLWLKLASPLVVFGLANLVWTSSILLFLGNTNFLCLVFANVLTGLGHGSFMTCFSMVTADLVGAKSANRALGFGLLFAGVGALLAPPILGKLYDATTSYAWPVLVAAMVALHLSPISSLYFV